MTTEQNNEWGDIPQGWEVVALGDIAEIITGSTPSTLNAEFWNGDIAWITPTDIGENKDIYFGERNISKKGLKSIRELPKNTLLVTCIASIGKNAILRNLGACNQQINAIIPSNNFNIDFLYYFFENNKMELRNMAGITATPIISKALFSNFQITLPPKTEQTAIATVLSDTDKLIDSLTALIAKKQAIKSATMSQLLSGQKRLSEFANHSDGTPKTYIQTDNGKIPEDWEIVALGDVAEIITGSTPSTLNAEFWNGDIAWITPTDIGENKDIYFGERNISEKGLSSIRELPENSLLVTCIASIGKNAILKNRGSCNQQINAVIPSQEFNIEFLYYFFEKNKTELKNMAGITATPIISKALFSQFKIILPPKPEQTAIAQILSDMDSEIIALENRLNKTKALKQGLMHQLLTGKIRLGKN